MSSLWAADHQNHIRILIADDCEMTRLLLKFLLDDFQDLYLVGMAGDGEEALRLCGELQPDVVIMDAGMPVIDGLTATSLIHRQYPQTRVILLSLCRYEDLPEVALEAGAFGYIQKPCVDRELVKMVRAAAESTLEQVAVAA